MKDANSTEFDPETPYPVIALVTEWTDDAKVSKQTRKAQDDLGGTMRLGGQACQIDALLLTPQKFMVKM